MNRKKTTAFNIKLFCVIAPILVVIAAIYVFWLGPIIFQEGNPVPYYYAVQKVNDGQPYAQVDNTTGTFITKQEDCPELIEHIEKTWNSEFIIQEGGVLVFSNEDSNIFAEIRVFWRKYLLYEVVKDLGL